jgi:hypothetical protein
MDRKENGFLTAHLRVAFKRCSHHTKVHGSDAYVVQQSTTVA